ncbi:N-acetylmuramoyl-L-alanine amidase [Desulfobulbus alkaliphilus]|uniref:N-acetylmuramoyl-L-alanine amidase n=1 Tax=Desulfobulbus alkaliphilus TaxID=869814 RepID=UPI0019622E5B|nr:N-acetylmuramoyl-L-alanine amidase [Desulfobulbus alkaliphilus]MBM9537247.1 N-acetylmuramoyl-L-alanine amidase [Desulfobulbus alkaliphilus]
MRIPRNLSITVRQSFLALLLTSVVGCLYWSPADLAAQSDLPAIHQLKSESLALQYRQAKAYATQLEQDTARGKDRGAWLEGVRNFRKIHIACKNDALGPPSLFMIGTLYRRMYEQFGIPIDLDYAIEYYIDVATLYPRDALADDALFLAADSWLLHGHEESNAKAIALYHQIIQAYPDSDHAAKARSRLQEPAARHAQPLHVTAETFPSIPPGTAGNDPVQVLPVKYWSTVDYTRIVMQTSAPTSYTYKLLEKDGNQPRRIYIDFASSQSSHQNTDPIRIEDGLLKQIRTGQYDSGTVRVVLDLESLSDYRIFNLADPFRVIIDVHGTRQLTSSAKTAVQKTTVRDESSRMEQDKNLASAVEIPVITPGAVVAENVPNLNVPTLQTPGKKNPQTVAATKAIRPDEISLAQQLGLGIRKIVIDPGHGGKDPGAMAFGVKEKEVVLKVSQKMARILEDNFGYEAVLTRSSDIYIPLEERTAIANTEKADLFVSIHVNAHPDKTIGGVETYFLNLATDAHAMRVAARENATSTHNIGEMQDILSTLMNNSKIDESSRLAQFIQNHLASGLGTYQPYDHGVKQAPFYVLIGAEMPAVLVEISFITNPIEAELLQTDSYLQAIAAQIANGIAAYVEHHHTAALRL